MRIDDVSDRMVFNDILSGHELLGRFVRQPMTKQIVGVQIYGLESRDPVVSLSANEFSAIRFERLSEMCEYWKMLGVFR